MASIVPAIPRISHRLRTDWQFEREVEELAYQNACCPCFLNKEIRTVNKVKAAARLYLQQQDAMIRKSIIYGTAVVGTAGHVGFQEIPFLAGSIDEQNYLYANSQQLFEECSTILPQTDRDLQTLRSRLETMQSLMNQPTMKQHRYSPLHFVED